MNKSIRVGYTWAPVAEFLSPKEWEHKPAVSSSVIVKITGFIY
jgi:hypothetical protein